jgi:fibronectin type 3 domain-containing protein
MCRSAVRIRWSLLLVVCGSLAAAPEALPANVRLAWDPSPDPGIASYKVYYGAASGNYTNSVSAGTATSVTISNLAQGVTFYFAATATDTNGLESDFSDEVSGRAGNQTPTLNILANVNVNEDAGPQTVNLSGISSGAAYETQTLTVTATSGNTALIPNPSVSYTSPNATGSLTFTPVANASGSASITVTVDDGGASSNIISRVFTVTVSPVNDAPTLNTLSDLALNESAGLQTINLSGISSGAPNESQTLTVTATSGNTALIPNPSVSYTSPNATGSLTFTPAAASSGFATVTVTVRDGGASNNVTSRTFTVTVNSVNQPPTISAVTNRLIAMDSAAAGIPFTIGDRETTASSLTVSGSSDNQLLVPNSNITFGGNGANRNVTVTPASGQTGTANITVTVSDGTASATSSFLLTVRRRPAAPPGLRLVSQ